MSLSLLSPLFIVCSSNLHIDNILKKKKTNIKYSSGTQHSAEKIFFFFKYYTLSEHRSYKRELEFRIFMQVIDIDRKWSIFANVLFVTLETWWLYTIRDIEWAAGSGTRSTIQYSPHFGIICTKKFLLSRAPDIDNKFQRRLSRGIRNIGKEIKRVLESVVHKTYKHHY